MCAGVCAALVLKLRGVCCCCCWMVEHMGGRSVWAKNRLHSNYPSHLYFLLFHLLSPFLLLFLLLWVPLSRMSLLSSSPLHPSISLLAQFSLSPPFFLPPATITVVVGRPTPHCSPIHPSIFMQSATTYCLSAILSSLTLRIPEVKEGLGRGTKLTFFLRSTYAAGSSSGSGCRQVASFSKLVC